MWRVQEDCRSLSSTRSRLEIERVLCFADTVVLLKNVSLSLSLMKLRYDETTQCFGTLTWLAYDQCRVMLVQIMTTYAGLLDSYTYSLVGIDMDFLGFRSRPFSEKVATLGR